MTESTELSQRLAGQMTALITPYSDSGSVDLQGFGDHVRFQRERGVTVLAAAGTIGDSPYLTMAERLGLVRVLAEETGTDGVAVAGIPSERPQEAVDATVAAGEVGAHAVLVMIPSLLKLTPDEQWAFWQWFDERTALPFIVYSTPHAASGRVTADLAGRLAGLNRIVAVKDAFPDLEHLKQLVDATDLPVIAAAEKILPGAIDAGVAGFMTASSCFAPELMWHLWFAERDGNPDIARDAFARVLAFRSLFQAEMDRGYPTFMAATRAACEARGLPSGAPRFPLSGAGPDLRAAISDRVEDMVSAPFDIVPERFGTHS